jgi:phage internal scaffolding protein
MEFKTAYGPKTKVVLDCSEDPGKTQQHQKDECDINKIIKRYDKHGVITHLTRNKPRFIDVGEVEFQDAMNLVVDAQEMFNELPAETRNRFANSPGNLLGFIQDENNYEEAKKYDLHHIMKEPEVEKPIDNEPVEPAPAEPAPAE